MDTALGILCIIALPIYLLLTQAISAYRVKEVKDWYARQLQAQAAASGILRDEHTRLLHTLQKLNGKHIHPLHRLAQKMRS